MLFSVLFVAETVPNFGAMINLIGGSTIALCALIFPCLFYLYLTAAENIKRKNLTILNLTKEKQLIENDENLTILRLTFLILLIILYIN